MNTRANRKVQGGARNIEESHAVVLGGSLAGFLAPRILADHFDKVTILERDAYLETTEVRKGVPQANHVTSWKTRTGEMS
jgi:alanine dehydrogenase